ncbi:MAG TPA: ABC transporter permease [Vicinamibacterales bacterium]|nr:ABC transporter permease [Vicinamibacterales bacterium]
MLRHLRALWNNVVHATQLEKDLNEELDAYAELVAADKIRSGIARDEAERQTRCEMGGVEQIREAVRDVRVGVSLERLAQDVRFGARTLSKNRAFSLVAIATLALGIGANTAMFSIVDQMLLRLLPVKQPDLLVKVTVLGNNFGDSYGADRMSWPMFEDLRNRNEVFSGMFCRFPATVAIGYGDRTAQVRAELVSGSYFSVLGIGAALGRTIGTDDDKVPDSHPVVVLSYSFWQNSFNADRSIVGRPVVLNGHTMTVIGVAQAGFDGIELGSPAQMFVPIMMKTEMTPHSDGLKDGRRRLAWVAAYGRLKSGIDARQAQRSLQPLLHSILAEEVQLPDFRPFTVQDRQQFLRNQIVLLPGSDSSLRTSMRRPLWILFALTGAVLLLACANLANLMLARATAREREIAVRLAIGATRRRIIRQLMVESLLLCGAGATLGLALAFVADRVLLRLYLTASEVADVVVSPIPDWRALGFAFSLLLVTTIAFGLMPALRGSRTELARPLHERSGTGAAAGVSLRRLFVIVQMALSLLLLVGAGLFVRTLQNLQNQGPGFPTEHLLEFSLDPSLSGYTNEQTESFYERLTENLRAMPGVSSVGLSTMPLLKGSAWQNAVLGDHSSGARAEEQPVLDEVGPNYFSTLGIPILEGREFTNQDRGSQKYAVVNQSFAKRYLPPGDPVGQRFGLVDDRNSTSPTDIQVVGVIPDTKSRNLRETPPPQAYFPYFQGASFRFMTVYLRTQGDARALERQVQERMRQFDPHVPIVGLQSMDDRIGWSLRTERLVASLSAVFGGLALLLALIGLYGVMAYTVSQRTREMALRMALGATRSKIIGMVMREASIMIVVGLSVGGLLALASTNFIRSQLFAVNPHDPWTLVGSSCSLAIAAGFAGFIPALRASAADATSALRQD